MVSSVFGAPWHAAMGTMSALGAVGSAVGSAVYTTSGDAAASVKEAVGLKETQPVVLAVRHAESVANVAKSQDRTAYYKRAWLEEPWRSPDERLRDCILSPNGIASTLKVTLAADKLNEDVGGGEGKVLILVSPLTRTILTAALLFHTLEASGRQLSIALEPTLVEVFDTLEWT